jgi:DNA topoisomerase-2
MEETYIAMDYREHILKKSDMHIGIGKLGFYKICDKIFINAFDQTVREPTCDTIKITIDQNTGFISVWNNGINIPIAIHKVQKIMIPELIFGTLLESHNYDNNDEKILVNSHGLKLTNIFSKKFMIEVSNGKQVYKQGWLDNMCRKTEPDIIDVKSDIESYVLVKFLPDFERLGLTHVTDNMVGLLKKRVYDLIGSKKIKVYFNDELLVEQ